MPPVRRSFLKDIWSVLALLIVILLGVNLEVGYAQLPDVRVIGNSIRVSWRVPLGQPSYASPRWLATLGFVVERGWYDRLNIRRRTYDMVDVWFPMWIVFAIIAFPPACWLLHKWRFRLQPGHCSACGYNLTGNVSGVCPECGTKIARLNL
jgi:hypothetical protein